ncbi:MAG TPA: sigma-70 family RNA polymerase sigma factor [Asanoa sp.]|nr:sigma-70 family RNA polymerase sigma factor [Asanoa sp.]
MRDTADAARPGNRAMRVHWVAVIPAQRAPLAAEAASAPVEVDAATRWALAARDGDPVAQAAFVRATQTEVWRLAAALVDPDAADDVAQETYLRAFRALPSFEGRSSVRTWLLGITRRACADHLRSVVRRRRLRSRLEAHPEAERTVMSAAEPDPAHRFDSTELLRRLPPDRRSAFVLTQLIGLSYSEAALVEGVPVGTIRSRVARARAELVAVLDATGAG